jgi:hypothetical protein
MWAFGVEENYGESIEIGGGEEDGGACEAVRPPSVHPRRVPQYAEPR